MLVGGEDMIKKIKSVFTKMRYINTILNRTYENSEETKKLCGEIEIIKKELNSIKEYNVRINQTVNKIEKVTNKIEKVTNKTENGYDFYVNYEYSLLLHNKRKKILLVGFYGAKNLGDELMMQKIYTDLEHCQDDIWVMLCDNVDLDIFNYPITNIIHYPKTKFDYSFLADQFECLIFGGGAIIDDGCYGVEDSYRYDMGRIFIELSTSFAEKGKEIYAIGLSASDCLTEKGYIKKLKNIVKKSQAFYVRDKYSQEVIEVATDEKITSINDIVLTNQIQQNLLDVPCDCQLKKVGIIWVCYEEEWENCKKVIDKLNEMYSGNELLIKLIPFYDYCDNDFRFYEKVKEEYLNQDNIVIEKMAYDFEEIYTMLKDLDLIISMRYHGALVGLMTGRNTYALLYGKHRHYKNKMLDLFEKFNCGSHLCYNIEELLDNIKEENFVHQKLSEVVFDNSEYEKVINEICTKYGRS